jgi:hypothetical protein
MFWRGSAASRGPADPSLPARRRSAAGAYRLRTSFLFAWPGACNRAPERTPC